MNTPNKDYTFQFTSSQPVQTIFNTLLDVHLWWVGLFGEEITGHSQKLNDEFTFSAGGGMHTTSHKLVELVPGKKIKWLVTKSNLTFLQPPNEWTSTHMSFELTPEGDNTHITFTHHGLQPSIECYNQCTDAWGQYLRNLAHKLK